MDSTPLVVLVVALVLAGTAVGLGAWGRGTETTAGDVRVGMPAPDFTLRASDGRTYTLSAFRGRQAVVVAWFPKAFTGG